MRIERKRIGELNAAPYNPRVALRPGMPGYQRLARSVREFGLVQPIVWNERTGHVVSGHQRLEVLRNEGVAEVEAVVVSLPLEREKALNVALNNSQVGGDWDAGKLVDLLEELCELPDVDETLTGFDGDELRNLLLEPEDEFAPDNEEQTEDGLVRVVLEVPEENWETVRAELDRWAERGEVRIHVRES